MATIASLSDSTVPVDGECGSLSQESRNVRPPGWLTVRANRARELFRAAGAAVVAKVGKCATPFCFTHWETYGGSVLETGDLPAGTRIVCLVDRVHASRLSNKGTLARLLKDKGVSHLAPATYSSVSEALAHPGPPVDVWFFKSTTGTAGKDMYCVSNADLASQTLPPHTIIQAGIRELALIDGCKFTVRIYVLLWNGGVWLNFDGFTLKHGVPYRAGSTDFGVQIDHRGYQKTDSPVRMEPLSRYADFDRYFPALRRLVEDLQPVLAECVAHSDRDRYLMLGIDVLFQTSGRVQLVEINTSPNFVHSKEINIGVNIPFFEAVMLKTLGVHDARLIEIDAG